MWCHSALRQYRKSVYNPRWNVDCNPSRWHSTLSSEKCQPTAQGLVAPCWHHSRPAPNALQRDHRGIWMDPENCAGVPGVYSHSGVSQTLRGFLCFLCCFRAGNRLNWLAVLSFLSARKIYHSSLFKPPDMVVGRFIFHQGFFFLLLSFFFFFRPLISELAERTQPHPATWSKISVTWKCMSKIWGIPFPCKSGPKTTFLDDFAT